MEAVIGKFEIPRDWEIRTEVSLIEPPVKLETPLMVKESSPLPRANLVIARRSAGKDETAEAARKKLLEELTKIMQQLQIEEESDYDFSDQIVGKAVTLVFPVDPQLRVIQRHVFRVDGDIITQLTATVAENDRKKIDGSLNNIIHSFSG